MYKSHIYGFAVGSVLSNRLRRFTFSHFGHSSRCWHRYVSFPEQTVNRGQTILADLPGNDCCRSINPSLPTAKHQIRSSPPHRLLSRPKWRRTEPAWRRARGTGKATDSPPPPRVIIAAFCFIFCGFDTGPPASYWQLEIFLPLFGYATMQVFWRSSWLVVCGDSIDRFSCEKGNF